MPIATSNAVASLVGFLTYVLCNTYPVLCHLWSTLGNYSTLKEHCIVAYNQIFPHHSGTSFMYLKRSLDLQKLKEREIKEGQVNICSVDSVVEKLGLFEGFYSQVIMEEA